MFLGLWLYTDVVEWTDDSIKMWTFRQGEVPSDITQGEPDPSTWIKPSFNTISTSGSCDTAPLFDDQKIVINLDFCATAGDTYYWGLTDTYKADNSMTCPQYVAENGKCLKHLGWISITVVSTVSHVVCSSFNLSRHADFCRLYRCWLWGLLFYDQFRQDLREEGCHFNIILVVCIILFKRIYF